MIAFLTGRVAERGATSCVLEVGGFGLNLAMSTGSLAALPHEGDTVRVHTYLHVRDDELSLFGFSTVEEKRMFELLITVSGVGPKVALAALSAYSPTALVEAISSEDVAVVSSVPGVGKKTAQRIILELKEKVAAASGGGSAPAPDGAANDAREALLAMGFSPPETTAALKGAQRGASTDELVRHALRRLGGGQ